MAGTKTRSSRARPHASMSAMVSTMAGILGKYLVGGAGPRRSRGAARRKKASKRFERDASTGCLVEDVVRFRVQAVRRDVGFVEVRDYEFSPGSRDKGLVVFDGPLTWDADSMVEIDRAEMQVSTMNGVDVHYQCCQLCPNMIS